MYLRTTLGSQLVDRGDRDVARLSGRRAGVRGWAAGGQPDLAADTPPLVQHRKGGLRPKGFAVQEDAPVPARERGQRTRERSPFEIRGSLLAHGTWLLPRR
jgi:hypothetical protein